MSALTETEWSDKRRYWRAMARTWASRWAWHQKDLLIDDLESVAWEVWSRLGPTHPRLNIEVQNAMQDEIALWLYGVTRCQRPRRVEFSILGDGLIDPEPGPLRRLLMREQIKSISVWFTEGEISTWLRATWPMTRREDRVPHTRRWQRIRQRAVARADQ